MTPRQYSRIVNPLIVVGIVAALGSDHLPKWWQLAAMVVAGVTALIMIVCYFKLHSPNNPDGKSGLGK